MGIFAINFWNIIQIRSEILAATYGEAYYILQVLVLLNKGQYEL